MTPTFTTNIASSEPVLITGDSLLPTRNSRAAGGSDCRRQLDSITDQIESSEVRTILRTVFADLMRLLECLTLIERHLRHVHQADATFAFFQLIHDEARCLVDFIRNEALTCEGMSDELADTLDGVSFALGHDLRRVFESDNCDSNFKGAPYTVLSKVHRAHDVLTNCLQQSTVSLAIVFDHTLVGARLFNNSDMRYRQSLQLCQDLLTLTQLVEMFQETQYAATLSDLVRGLDRFRNESMECLMYSDWPQFESFCERITVAADDYNSLAPVLHQFQCYLEALLGQVRMRAVLAEASNPNQAQSDAAPSTSPFNSQTEETVWNTFAFAI